MCVCVCIDTFLLMSFRIQSILFQGFQHNNTAKETQVMAANIYNVQGQTAFQ